ncbi:MAG: hypothetical protein RMK52_03600 [Chitinophagales bacterium]|nr:hypothetical protein [Chitinophagales bacterium]MDW8393312.1 hypothetical protein [Chitinophagales bacterium]
MKNFLPLLFALLLISCSKTVITEPPGPLFNPYDTIQYDQDAVPAVPLDSTSLPGLHQYIFSTKCAVSGCHDGSFEPDFRTPYSAFNTLVYAPVVKNTAGQQFTYRVIPYDTAASWLWYRLTTDDAVLGRMPLYDTLAPAQRNKIREWILAGAPDLFGNVRNQPSAEPGLYGLVAYLPDHNNLRVDTIRNGIIINPFLVPANTNLKIWFGLADDKTYPFFFTYNKVRFSTNAFDFSNAKETPLEVTFTPHYEWLFGYQLPFFLSTTVNTGWFKPGDLVYMRVYVQDADHQTPTEIPDNGSQSYMMLYSSFLIQ